MTQDGYQIAELNIARVIAPLDDPSMKEFVDSLEEINALAEASPGFVWRLKDDDTGDATKIEVFDDPEIIVNLSVWESVELLKEYVYRSHHASFLKRRKKWFKLMGESYFVMWWVQSGHLPSVQEATRRLEYFRQHGSTPFAFNINGNFSARDAERYAEMD